MAATLVIANRDQVKRRRSCNYQILKKTKNNIQTSSYHIKNFISYIPKIQDGEHKLKYCEFVKSLSDDFLKYFNRDIDYPPDKYLNANFHIVDLFANSHNNVRESRAVDSYIDELCLSHYKLSSDFLEKCEIFNSYVDYSTEDYVVLDDEVIKRLESVVKIKIDVRIINIKSVSLNVDRKEVDEKQNIEHKDKNIEEQKDTIREDNPLSEYLNPPDYSKQIKPKYRDKLMMDRKEKKYSAVEECLSFEKIKGKRVLSLSNNQAKFISSVLYNSNYLVTRDSDELNALNDRLNGVVTARGIAPGIPEIEVKYSEFHVRGMCESVNCKENELDKACEKRMPRNLMLFKEKELRGSDVLKVYCPDCCLRNADGLETALRGEDRCGAALYEVVRIIRKYGHDIGFEVRRDKPSPYKKLNDEVKNVANVDILMYYGDNVVQLEQDEKYHENVKEFDEISRAFGVKLYYNYIDNFDKNKSKNDRKNYYLARYNYSGGIGNFIRIIVKIASNLIINKNRPIGPVQINSQDLPTL